MSGRVTVNLMLAAATVAAVSASGCSVRVGGRDPVLVNRELREENVELTMQNEELAELVSGLKGRLKSVEAALAENPSPSHQAAAKGAPVLAGVELDRYSGPVDTDGDDRDDVIRLYIKPMDQHGTLLRWPINAEVRAVTVPAEGEPRVVAMRSFDADEFKKAFREGFTGSHYTLELPLPEELGEDAGQLAVRVVLHDRVHGAAFDAVKTYRVTR